MGSPVFLRHHLFTREASVQWTALMSNAQHLYGAVSMKKGALKLSEPWKWWKLLEVFLFVVSLCCLVFAELFVCYLTVLSCVC